VGKAGVFARFLIPLLVGALVLPAPAAAQFSKSYKFLEAVRKKEGGKVEEALSEPGSTIVNTHDSTSGETALHIVTARRDLTWMSYLIAKGANVDARDGRGATALQLAVSRNFPEGVDLLIGQKARVHDPNSAGETALITAVHLRNIAMMRALLKAGADPDRPDNSGRSARDYAVLEGRVLVSEIEANAKPRTPRPATARPSYGPKL
jgi:uncharacterized protein